MTPGEKHQAAYIRTEKARMKKANLLWRKYVAAMGKLGLHALTPDEMISRSRELDCMQTDLESGAWGERQKIFLKAAGIVDP